MSWLWILLVFLIFFILIRKYSPYIYDIVIVNMTSLWYKVVLEDIPKNSKILDIGIGTGTSLCKNSSIITEKNLKIQGVDIDSSYVQHCKKNFEKLGLEKQCSVVCKSIFDLDLKQIVGDEYDAVYFSGSISLMPDPDKALKIAKNLLKKGGKVYITQTYQLQNVPFLGFLKPLLKYLTTIDFGKLTFEKEINEIIQKSGLEVELKTKIKNSVDNQFQAAFLIILK